MQPSANAGPVFPRLDCGVLPSTRTPSQPAMGPNHLVMNTLALHRHSGFPSLSSEDTSLYEADGNSWTAFSPRSVQAQIVIGLMYHISSPSRSRRLEFAMLTAPEWMLQNTLGYSQSTCGGDFKESEEFADLSLQNEPFARSPLHVTLHRQYAVSND